jgi:hypothetical protein
MLGAVLRPIRTLISLVFLAGMVWFCFAVRLGERTLAEHVDQIGQTREAQELIEGTRSTVNPMLEEAKDRVLGEHVEAPTSTDQVPMAVSDDAGRPTRLKVRRAGDRPPKRIARP